MTAKGLAALDAALAGARAAYAAAQSEGGAAPPTAPRYGPGHAATCATTSARRASAQLVPNSERRCAGKVAFGGTVTFEREDGRRQSFRIVGEDEADPAKGAVSYVSPLAQALLGKEVGDVALVAGAEVEVVEVG